MQGDVTRIVSMSNRDRRGLIDELAGVALFDSRIEQTKSKLDDVQERQERCGIVEQELIASKRRLEKDCEKAKIYKELREQLQVGKQQEMVLSFEFAEQNIKDLRFKRNQLEEKKRIDVKGLSDLEKCRELIPMAKPMIAGYHLEGPFLSKLEGFA